LIDTKRKAARKWTDSGGPFSYSVILQQLTN
jgi:hypothetical protein